MSATITDAWVKVEAGHYVHTTDDGYTATVGKESYGNYWWAESVSPSGKVRTSDGSQDWRTMKDAKAWALWQIDHLVQQDETEALARRLRQQSVPTTGRPIGEVEMNGPGDQTASFIIPLGGSLHHTYKVTVERWNG